MPVDPNCYAVYHDGRPVHRGLSKAEAYRHAEYFSSNVDRKNCSSKRRTPCVEVRVDTQLVKHDDELYKWAKNGG
jgi:hypothetical protein